MVLEVESLHDSLIIVCAEWLKPSTHNPTNPLPCLQDGTSEFLWWLYQMPCSSPAWGVIFQSSDKGKCRLLWEMDINLITRSDIRRKVFYIVCSTKITDSLYNVMCQQSRKMFYAITAWCWECGSSLFSDSSVVERDLCANSRNEQTNINSIAEKIFGHYDYFPRKASKVCQSKCS